MKLHQLYYFLEICRQENITRAAKILHVSQPSMTVAIRELEKELGVSLFQRVNQRIHLTAEGNYFYTELLPILSDLDSLTDSMKNMGTGKNLVKIGIPPMMGSFLFPQLFREFKTYNPKIRLEISESGALQMQKMLLDEVLDLSMIIGESMTSDNIEFNPLMTCSISLCVPQDHPLATQKKVSLKAIAQEPLVLFDSGFYTIKLVMDKLKELQIQPNVILETSQINTIKQFISNHLACSFLIENCILPQDHIATVQIEELSPVTIGIAWKRHRLLSSDAIKMIHFSNTLFSA